jgi:PAS domain S-box-containing protein
VFRALIDAANRARLGLAISRIEQGELALVYANRALEEMLGYDARTLAARPVWSLFPPEEVARIRAMAEDLARGLGAPTVFETTVLRSDGRAVPVQASTSAVELDGHPANVTFLLDLTDRKASLEHLVHADKMAAVGTLAAGVAHEINNPLAYLLLNLEILVRELPKIAADPTRLEGAMARLEEARQGALRVKSIVADLQVFTRADQGIRGPVDLSSAITRALQVARHDIRQRATVEAALDEVPPVFGNATRFEQVFLNLLINASHAFASPDATRNRIELRLCAQDDDHVVATVRDNGVGMSDDVMRRAFEPFYTTKAGTGTGLGLAICHGIVQGAGGTIGLHSQPGTGTTVTVVLPIARDAIGAR